MESAARGNTIRVPWGCWFADTTLDLDFPSGWSTEVCPPTGGRDIGEAGIARAFDNPIGSRRISQLARGRRSAAIVVDDLSRPTPAWRVLPTLLEEIAAGGISRDDVTIIMGVACHRQLIREDMVKKLGVEIVESVRVRNHFAWDDVTRIGTTSFGTPVDVNSGFLAADLKICLGGILPHSGPGFGGGAKLVLPGVAGIATIYSNHRSPELGGPRKGLGWVDGNESRLDMEEAARLAGLDAIVNTVITPERGIAGLFVGDFVAAHRAGVAFARRALATRAPTNADVVVLNGYPKDTELVQIGLAFNPWISAGRPLVDESGTVVVLSAASEGYGFHSLHGPGMKLAAGVSPRAVVGGRRLIVVCPTVSRRDLPEPMRADDGLLLVRTWAEARALLEEQHGPSARAAVFPVAAMQICAA